MKSISFNIYLHKFKLIFFIFLLSSALVGCGGGGNSSNSSNNTTISSGGSNTSSSGSSTTSGSSGSSTSSSSGSTTANQSSSAPMVLYTDITSGPNYGGENNDGTYLSIFGKNFGSNLSNIQVKIGGYSVANYRYLGSSRGRTDIQQLTVQIGSIGSPTPGTKLPIDVIVNGVSSNTDHDFIVNPGRILFVSHSGNDSTAIPGDINHPYRYVQNGTDGAFDVAQAGDTIVLMGTPLNGASITSDPTSISNAWTDNYQGYFLRFINVDGTAQQVYREVVLLVL